MNKNCFTHEPFLSQPEFGAIHGLQRPIRKKLPQLRQLCFTLAELVVVMVIISALLTIIAPSAFRAIEKAKITKAIADFKTIRSACNAIYADTGRWPGIRGGEERLKNSFLFSKVNSLGEEALGWDGPYLEQFLERHPWGGTYLLEGQNNWGKGLPSELILEYEDFCYPTGPNSPRCGVKKESAFIIDKTVDDANLDTGEARYGFSSPTDFGRVLIWDNW